MTYLLVCQSTWILLWIGDPCTEHAEIDMCKFCDGESRYHCLNPQHHPSELKRI